MKRLIALLLLVPVIASGQPVSQLPDIGRLMVRSRDYQYLTDDNCLLIFNKRDQHFACADPRLVSIAFPPTSFGLGAAVPPTLSCGDPCQLVFTDSDDQVATIDWIMPSQALTGSSFLLEWTASASSGRVVWVVDWCKYRAGEAPCVPNGSHAEAVQSTTSGATVRNDAVLNPFSPDWEPSDHVVLTVQRLSTGNTLVGNVSLRGARLELTGD